MHDLAVAVLSREAGRLNLKVGDLKVRFRVLSHTSSIHFASKTHCCEDDINVDVYVLRGLRLLTKTAAAVNIRYSLSCRQDGDTRSQLNALPSGTS